MACYHPNPARELAPGRIKFKVAPEYATHWLPCGKCLGCRDAETATWALRLQHEARSHSHNTFLTLTYDDAHLPLGLQIPDMQKFWKRLRRALPNKIKTFYCGEYGDRTKRPHYHAAVFGSVTQGDETRWDNDNLTSESLNAIWGNGLVTISELTPYRMAYVAGYVLKKAGYKKQLYCDEDGVELQPPFRKMSVGLGKQWLEKYANDLRLGYAQTEGRKLSIPRYYNEIIKKTRPDLAEMIQKNKDTEREKRPPPDKNRNKAAEKIREQQVKKARRDRV